MKRKKIKVPIFIGSLSLYECEDFKEVVKKYNLTDASACSAFAFKNKSEYVMAFLKDHSNNDVAHESLHVVDYIFRDIGADMGSENKEVQCYLLGWVVEQCHKFLDKDVVKHTEKIDIAPDNE